MQIISQTELATLAGVSAAAISLAVKRHRLAVVKLESGLRGIDLDDPKARAYLNHPREQRHRGQRQSGRQPARA